MAKLYISEYSTYGVDPNTGEAVGKEPSLDQAPVTVGAGSLQGAAFSASTRLVRIHTDVICSIVFGTPGGPNNPVATANNKRLAANQTEYFAVSPGDTVAVITNT
ncbi:MAG TPA: hypothetical protein VF748_15085 [Candidatus Acidoferrum sp.]